MRIGILTREWPPEIYGGAGVHVEYLCRALAPLADVSVHAFGGVGASVHTADPALSSANESVPPSPVLHERKFSSRCTALWTNPEYARGAS